MKRSLKNPFFCPSICLLGKITAVPLGVVKVGLQMNEIKDEEIFTKLKDVVIHVSQPHRRIPISLEKIQNNLKELVKRDIIEEVNGFSKWESPIVLILK